MATVVALLAVATIGFNASLWLRHKAMAAARGDWSDADFAMSLVELGCSTEVVAAVRSELESYYSAGLIPRADDDVAKQLLMDGDEVELVVEARVPCAGSA